MKEEYKDKTRWRWKDWKVNFEITHVDGEVYTFDEVDVSHSDEMKLLEESLDLGFNVNSFRNLSKDGTFQVQSLTKALEK